VRSLLGLGPEALSKVLLSVLAVALVWLVRRITLRVAERRFEDPRTRYQWAKSSSHVAFVVALLVLGQIWLEAVRNVGTFLGLLSAGLAIALRDLVTNTAGWVFILLRHPFHVGDRIQTGDHRGDVVDIRLFQFTLLEIGNWVDADQSTGRLIHVPNARVFTEPLANYTDEFPYVWHELRVLITFESNWRKAKDILQRILQEQAGGVADEAAAAVRKASRKFLIYYRTLTPKVYTDVKESGVQLTLRFISPARRRRGFTEELWEAILDAFASESDIDLAYPTRRVFTNVIEGKEGARADLPGPLRNDS
jgi:small-conductance mechanosensitive channel